MKIIPNSCVNSPCRYFDPNGSICRKKPPAVVSGGRDHNGYIVFETVWVNVNFRDWCGEGEVKE